MTEHFATDSFILQPAREGRLDLAKVPNSISGAVASEFVPRFFLAGLLAGWLRLVSLLARLHPGRVMATVRLGAAHGGNAASVSEVDGSTYVIIVHVHPGNMREGEKKKKRKARKSRETPQRQKDRPSSAPRRPPSNQRPPRAPAREDSGRCRVQGRSGAGSE